MQTMWHETAKRGEETTMAQETETSHTEEDGYWLKGRTKVEKQQEGRANRNSGKGRRSYGPKWW